MSMNWSGGCKPADSTKSCSSQDMLSAYIKRHGTRISEFNNSRVNVLQCGEHKTSLLMFWAFLVVQMVKNLPAMWETWTQPLDGEDPPGGGHGNPLQHSCLEKSHGQSCLVGYSPCGCKAGHDWATKHSTNVLPCPVDQPHLGQLAPISKQTNVTDVSKASPHERLFSVNL